MKITYPIFVAPRGVVRVIIPVVFGHFRLSLGGGGGVGGWLLQGLSLSLPFRFLLLSLPPPRLLLSLRLLPSSCLPWFLSLLLILLFLLLRLPPLLHHLLCLSSPRCFASTLPPSTPSSSSFSFSIVLLLPSAPAPVSLPSFTPSFARLSASSGAPSVYSFSFVSSASSSTAVSWSLPPVATCSAPSLALSLTPAPSVSFPTAPSPPFCFFSS